MGLDWDVLQIDDERHLAVWFKCEMSFMLVLKNTRPAVQMPNVFHVSIERLPPRSSSTKCLSC
ncbi:hypothetical protein [Metabacillus niabensis]|uniref:hypothetical protein n=1 Tax=Metabacillus niabensis TaxID=324854 RepID=UPI001CFAC748|nr:hypothetical protein [Metabacillus niabensis]